MNGNLIGNHSERQCYSSPKAFDELNNTLASLKLKPSPIGDSNPKDINYIKPKIIRKVSLRPSTGYERPGLMGQRSLSIENTREKLYTGNIDDYSLGQTLGFGAYAVVKLAIFHPNNSQFAIKTYEKSKLLDPQRKKNMISEIKILKSINHPNIIKMKEAIDATRHIHIVMEYVGGCSL